MGVRLRNNGVGRGWCGRWGDHDQEAWHGNAGLANQLRTIVDSEFLVPCGCASSDGAPIFARPQMPLNGEGANEETADGTFVMRFDDWLQVFSHVFVSRQLTEQRGWSAIFLHGRWGPGSCGGTPIPVKQPVLATEESWARNPQCRLVLMPSQSDGLEVDDVEICVSLQ